LVFVSDRSRSGLAENLGQIVFLKSCARLFLPFLLSVEIPPQVPPDWKRGGAIGLKGNIATLCHNSPATMRMRWGKEEPGLHRQSISEGGGTSKEEDDNAAEAKLWRGRGCVVLLRRQVEG